MKENAKGVLDYKAPQKVKLFSENQFSNLRSHMIQDTECLLVFGLSDRCRRSSLVATPKIIHRMIFACDILHYAFYIMHSTLCVVS